MKILVEACNDSFWVDSNAEGRALLSKHGFCQSFSQHSPIEEFPNLPLDEFSEMEISFDVTSGNENQWFDLVNQGVLESKIKKLTINLTNVTDDFSSQLLKKALPSDAKIHLNITVPALKKTDAEKLAKLSNLTTLSLRMSFYWWQSRLGRKAHQINYFLKALAENPTLTCFQLHETAWLPDNLEIDFSVFKNSACKVYYSCELTEIKNSFKFLIHNLPFFSKVKLNFGEPITNRRKYELYDHDQVNQLSTVIWREQAHLENSEITIQVDEDFFISNFFGLLYCDNIQIKLLVNDALDLRFFELVPKNNKLKHLEIKFAKDFFALTDWQTVLEHFPGLNTLTIAQPEPALNPDIKEKYDAKLQELKKWLKQKKPPVNIVINGEDFLSKEKATLETHWAHAAGAIGFLRSNRTHIYRDSIIPLLPDILNKSGLRVFENEKTQKSEMVPLPSTGSRILNTRFTKAHLEAAEEQKNEKNKSEKISLFPIQNLNVEAMPRNIFQALKGEELNQVAKIWQSRFHVFDKVKSILEIFQPTIYDNHGNHETRGLFDDIVAKINGMLARFNDPRTTTKTYGNHRIIRQLLIIIDDVQNRLNRYLHHKERAPDDNSDYFRREYYRVQGPEVAERHQEIFIWLGLKLNEDLNILLRKNVELQNAALTAVEKARAEIEKPPQNQQAARPR